ncbi:hypothetical protein SKAU_G00278930 [Synaphobranchus kaupii]|uniref:Uncharacterized protein n=1 Tax=Synaphobranchus kaupii TaxID=118154 RepID=A0A9Q1ILN0_SYNKA|nr:hypothetical protein SKAU_G00278930 [Synaphobranchus kaupii]
MSVCLNQASDTEGTLPLLEQITLSEFISQLIQLSDQDRDELQQHSAEECEAEVLSRSNERLNSEVQDLRLSLKRASDALEEHSSKLDECEPSQGAATSLLFCGNAQELPTSRPNPQTRASFAGLLHDRSKGEEYSASEDETEYYGNGSCDSRRSLSRLLDAHSRHESRGRSTERRHLTCRLTPV